MPEARFANRQELLAEYRRRVPAVSNVPDDQLYAELIERYPHYERMIAEQPAPVPVPDTWIGPPPSKPLSLIPGGKEYERLATRSSKRGFWEASMDVGWHDVPFIADLFDVGSGIAQNRRLSALNRGERLSDEDLVALNQYQAYQRRLSEATIMGKVSDVIQGSAKFVTEIGAVVLSGGVAGGAKVGTIGTTATTKAAVKMLTEGMTTQVLKKAGKNSVKELGWREARRLAYDVGRVTKNMAVDDWAMQTAAKWATTTAGKRAGTEAVNKAAQIVARGAYSGATGLGMSVSALMAPKAVAAGQQARMRALLQGEDMSQTQALFMGWMDTAIELTTEQMGEALMMGLGAVGKPAVAAAKKWPGAAKAATDAGNIAAAYGRNMRAFVVENSPEPAKHLATLTAGFLQRAITRKFPEGTLGKSLSDTIAHVGLGNTLEEMSEERLGDFLRGLLGLEGSSWGLRNALANMIPSLEQLTVEALAFTLPGAVIQGADSVKQWRKGVVEKQARKARSQRRDAAVSPTSPTPILDRKREVERETTPADRGTDAQLVAAAVFLPSAPNQRAREQIAHDIVLAPHENPADAIANILATNMERDGADLPDETKATYYGVIKRLREDAAELNQLPRVELLEQVFGWDPAEWGVPDKDEAVEVIRKILLLPEGATLDEIIESVNAESRKPEYDSPARRPMLQSYEALLTGIRNERQGDAPPLAGSIALTPGETTRPPVPELEQVPVTEMRQPELPAMEPAAPAPADVPPAPGAPAPGAPAPEAPAAEPGAPADVPPAPASPLAAAMAPVRPAPPDTGMAPLPPKVRTPLISDLRPEEPPAEPVQTPSEVPVQADRPTDTAALADVTPSQILASMLDIIFDPAAVHGERKGAFAMLRHPRGKGLRKTRLPSAGEIVMGTMSLPLDIVHEWIHLILPLIPPQHKRILAAWLKNDHGITLTEEDLNSRSSWGVQHSAHQKTKDGRTKTHVDITGEELVVRAFLSYLQSVTASEKNPVKVRYFGSAADRKGTGVEGGGKKITKDVNQQSLLQILGFDWTEARAELDTWNKTPVDARQPLSVKALMVHLFDQLRRILFGPADAAFRLLPTTSKSKFALFKSTDARMAEQAISGVFQSWIRPIMLAPAEGDFVIRGERGSWSPKEVARTQAVYGIQEARIAQTLAKLKASNDRMYRNLDPAAAAEHLMELWLRLSVNIANLYRETADQTQETEKILVDAIFAEGRPLAKPERAARGKGTVTTAKIVVPKLIRDQVKEELAETVVDVPEDAVSPEFIRGLVDDELAELKEQGGVAWEEVRKIMRARMEQLFQAAVKRGQAFRAPFADFAALFAEIAYRKRIAMAKVNAKTKQSKQLTDDFDEDTGNIAVLTLAEPDAAAFQIAANQLLDPDNQEFARHLAQMFMERPGNWGPVTDQKKSDFFGYVVQAVKYRVATMVMKQMGMGGKADKETLITAIAQDAVAPLDAKEAFADTIVALRNQALRSWADLDQLIKNGKQVNTTKANAAIRTTLTDGIRAAVSAVQGWYPDANPDLETAVANAVANSIKEKDPEKIRAVIQTALEANVPSLAPKAEAPKIPTSVRALKAALKQEGLVTTGNRAALEERLRKFYEAGKPETQKKQKRAQPKAPTEDARDPLRLLRADIRQSGGIIQKRGEEFSGIPEQYRATRQTIKEQRGMSFDQALQLAVTYGLAREEDSIEKLVELLQGGAEFDMGPEPAVSEDWQEQLDKVRATLPGIEEARIEQLTRELDDLLLLYITEKYPKDSTMVDLKILTATVGAIQDRLDALTTAYTLDTVPAVELCRGIMQQLEQHNVRIQDFEKIRSIIIAAREQALGGEEIPGTESLWETQFSAPLGSRETTRRLEYPTSGEEHEQQTSQRIIGTATDALKEGLRATPYADVISGLLPDGTMMAPSTSNEVLIAAVKEVMARFNNNLPAVAAAVMNNDPSIPSALRGFVMATVAQEASYQYAGLKKKRGKEAEAKLYKDLTVAATQETFKIYSALGVGLYTANLIFNMIPPGEMLIHVMDESVTKAQIEFLATHPGIRDLKEWSKKEIERGVNIDDVKDAVPYEPPGDEVKRPRPIPEPRAKTLFDQIKLELTDRVNASTKATLAEMRGRLNQFRSAHTPKFSEPTTDRMPNDLVEDQLEQTLATFFQQRLDPENKTKQAELIAKTTQQLEHILLAGTDKAAETAAEAKLFAADLIKRTLARHKEDAATVVRDAMNTFGLALEDLGEAQLKKLEDLDLLDAARAYLRDLTEDQYANAVDQLYDAMESREDEAAIELEADLPSSRLARRLLPRRPATPKNRYKHFLVKLIGNAMKGLVAQPPTHPRTYDVFDFIAVAFQDLETGRNILQTALDKVADASQISREMLENPALCENEEQRVAVELLRDLFTVQQIDVVGATEADPTSGRIVLIPDSMLKNALTAVERAVPDQAAETLVGGVPRPMYGRIRDIVTSTYNEQRATVDALVDEVVYRTGMSRTRVQPLVTRMHEITMDRLKQAKIARLNVALKLFNTRVSNDDANAWVDRMLGLIYAGAIDPEIGTADHRKAWEEEFARKFRLPVLTDEVKGHLMEYADRVNDEAAAANMEFEFMEEQDPGIRHRMYIGSAAHHRNLVTLQTELKKATGFTRMDLASALFFSFTLSGFSTQELNFFGTLPNAILTNHANIIAELRLNDKLTTEEKMKVYLQSWRGFWFGFRQGIRTWGHLLKENEIPGAPFVSEQTLAHAVPRTLESRPFTAIMAKYQLAWLGKIIDSFRYVARNLSGNDYAFARSAAHPALYAKLYLQAADHGLRGDAADFWVAATVWGVTGLDMSADGAEARYLTLAEQYTSGNQEAKDALKFQLDLRAAAHREAVNVRGLEPGSFMYHAAMEEMLYNFLPPAWRRDLENIAGRATYNIRKGDPLHEQRIMTSIMRGTKQLRYEYTWTQFVFPFIKIVTMIFNTGVDMSPFGLYHLTQVKADMDRKDEAKLGATEKDLAYLETEMLTGSIMLISLLAIAFTSLMLDDEDPFIDITGRGPRDYNLKNQLREAGYQEYTIKIGGTRWNYQMTPLGVPLAVVGSIMDEARYETGDSTPAMEHATVAMLRALPAVLDQTFIRTFADLLSVLSSPNPETQTSKLSNIFKRISSAFIVPNAVKQVTRFIDPTLRDGDGVLQEFMQEMPAPLPTLLGGRPRLNALGEPIMLGAAAITLSVPEILIGRDVNRLGRMITFDRAPEDSVWGTLAREQLVLPIPSRGMVLDGIPMTDEQLHEFAKYRGSYMRAWLTDRIQTGAWSMLTREEMQSDIQKMSRLLTNLVKAGMITGEWGQVPGKPPPVAR